MLGFETRPFPAERFAAVFAEARSRNPFYRGKYAGPVESWAEYKKLPFTTKNELALDQQQNPPYGTNRCDNSPAIVRLHQTSGTSSGRPLRCADTASSWNWVSHCWSLGLTECVGLTSEDRAYFPFSFGPFLGFWAAFDAVTQLGLFTIPGGGLSSTGRLKQILEHGITVVFATPTYALHLAEVAEAERLDLRHSSVTALVLAGEPGGSIPSTRARIESAWGARVFDHYGLSEVGPVAFETRATPNRQRVLESEFLVEVFEPNETAETSPGEIGELVLTNFGRPHAPAIRYRTGDLVRAERNANGELELVGGIIGRADDMIHVRGNNLYPSAIEAVVRKFPGVAEFRLVVDRSGPLADLALEIEPTPDADGPQLAKSVARAIRDELLFRAEVTPVPPGTLPRFELKARRVVTKVPTA